MGYIFNGWDRDGDHVADHGYYYNSFIMPAHDVELTAICNQQIWQNDWNWNNDNRQQQYDNEWYPDDRDRQGQYYDGTVTDRQQQGQDYGIDYDYDYDYGYYPDYPNNPDYPYDPGSRPGATYNDYPPIYDFNNYDDTFGGVG